MCVYCRSHSWSANVCGRKEWFLFPPGEENGLRDRHGRLPFDLRELHSQRCSESESAIRVIQEAGEAIFVPRYIGEASIMVAVVMLSDSC